MNCTSHTHLPPPPPPPPHTHTHTAKRKPGMSPQMLKRVNRWETNTPTTVPSPLTSTPIAHSSLSSIPLISTSTPFTSTPLTSTPFTNGRKDEEGVRSSTDVKRYAFQPRTVSQVRERGGMGERRKEGRREKNNIHVCTFVYCICIRTCV